MPNLSRSIIWNGFCYYMGMKATIGIDEVGRGPIAGPVAVGAFLVLDPALPEEIEKLEQRKKELEFSLSNKELAGESDPVDSKGLIENISNVDVIRFVQQKKKGQPRPLVIYLLPLVPDSVLNSWRFCR